MKELPQFVRQPLEKVEALATLLLTNKLAEETHLYRLIAYEDGHYRAVFRTSYFGEAVPTKSQWNTLKKRFKRHDPRLFLFKEYGELEEQNQRLYFLDFGFLLH